MSDNKLLAENTVRRFMKLASIKPLTNKFIKERYNSPRPEELEETGAINEEEEDDLGAMEDDMEPPSDEPDMDMDMDMDMGDAEPEMGAADISLTEEEASLLVDLGERLKAAMGESVEVDDEGEGEEELDEIDPEVDAPDETEEDEMEPQPAYRADGASYMQEEKAAIVAEVLKRVTKRVVAERMKNK